MSLGKTFKLPNSTTTPSLTVENCWDLQVCVNCDWCINSPTKTSYTVPYPIENNNSIEMLSNATLYNSNNHHSEHFSWPYWPFIDIYQVLVTSGYSSNHFLKGFRIYCDFFLPELLLKWPHPHLNIRMHVDWHDVINTEFSLLQTIVLLSITINTRCKNICLQLNTF